MKFIKGLIVVLAIGSIFLTLTVFADQMSGGAISDKIFSENFRLQTVGRDMF